MTGARVRRWLWSLIRFAVAASLVSFAAGALHDAILREAEDEAGRGAAALMSSGQPVLSGDERPFPKAENIRTSITVYVTPTALRGTYMLRLQKNDPLFLQLQHKVADLGGDRYAGQVLDQYVGYVGFGKRRSLSLKTASFTLDPKSQEALVTGSMEEAKIPAEEISNRSLSLGIGTPWRQKSGDGEAIFRGHGVQLFSLGRQPVEQSANPEETVLRFRFAPDDPPIRVGAFLPEPKKAPPKKIGAVFGSISGGYFDVVQPLVYACVNALPFVLFLSVFHDRRKEQQRFFTLSVCFIYLFLTLGVLRALIDLFWIVRPRFSETWLDYPWLSLDSIGVLSFAFVAWIWPWRVAQESISLGRFAPRLNAARFFAACFAFGAMAFAAYRESVIGPQLDRYGRDLFWPEWPLVLAIPLLAAAFWLALEVGARSGVIEVTVFSVGVFAFFAFDSMTRSHHALRVAGFWLTALPFTFAVAHLIDARAWRRFLIPIVAAVTLVLVWIRDGDSISSWWILTSIAWNLAEPLALLLLAVLVRILCSLSDHGEWAVLERAERDAGTVLILIILTLSCRNWLSVPIVLAAGGLMLKRWFFPAEKIASPGNEGATTIRDLIRYNEARRTLGQLKRELAKSAGSGTISFNDYRMKIDAMEAYVDELAAKLGGINSPRAALLSSGVPARPLARATTAAIYSFFAAIPWMAVFVYNTASGEAPAYGYQWLTVFSTVVLGIAQWPLYGFFFGYFYPHIRGNSGVSKGLSLFVLLALPAVIATAITIPLAAGAWTSLTFWALQLFVMALIVGMFAGDLETLHASNLGWRHLLDVHDLGSLTAYASTIVAAIGAAVTTFVAAQVPTVLTAAMQYFNAQPPR